MIFQSLFVTKVIMACAVTQHLRALLVCKYVKSCDFVAAVLFQLCCVNCSVHSVINMTVSVAKWSQVIRLLMHDIVTCIIVINNIMSKLAE